MAVREILLQMRSYPKPTPHWAADAAAWLGDKLDARITGAICQVHTPPVSNWLALEA